tara:strand:- start:219 stop:545 length:327 start_codon:yes stop_codon:yes gene_type:complete
MKGKTMEDKATKLQIETDEILLDVAPNEEFIIMMSWEDGETGEKIEFKPKVVWTGDSWDVGDTTLWLLTRINPQGVVVEYLRTTTEIAKMVQGKKAGHKRLVVKASDK